MADTMRRFISFVPEFRINYPVCRSAIRWAETGRRRLLGPVPLGLASFYAWFLEKLPVPLLTRDQIAMPI